MEHLFRHRVLRLLLCERRIDESVIRKLLGWRHSGFSLHNAVRIGAADSDGRRGVAEYILRSPFSLEKMRYQTKTGTIIYQSKLHLVLKRHFEVFSACDWMAAHCAQGKRVVVFTRVRIPGGIDARHRYWSHGKPRAALNGPLLVRARG